MTADELAQLIDLHASRLELYARQWTTVPADVVQEAFINLFRCPLPVDQPVAWLYKAVRHRALTQRRSEQRRRHHEVRQQTERPNWFENSRDSALDGEAATQALLELNEMIREIMIAHLWSGLSFQEIAELVGVSSSTAHRRYLEGLAELRKRLKVPCSTKE